MQRRAFLRWLGGTAAGVALAPTLDLEKLLWVPGAKTIVLPPVPLVGTLRTEFQWTETDREVLPFGMTDADVSAAAKHLADAIDRDIVASLMVPPHLMLKDSAAGLFNARLSPVRKSLLFSPMAFGLSTPVLNSQTT